MAMNGAQAADLLRHVTNGALEPIWLAENLNPLHEAISVEISHNYELAVTSLLRVMPCILQNEAIKQWSKLVNKALKRMHVHHLPMTGTILGPVYVFPEREHTYIETPKNRRRDRLNPRQSFEMYLALLLQPETSPYELDHQHLMTLLAFARHINTPYYTCKIYQTVAFSLLQHESYDRAYGYVDMVTDYFDQTKNRLEQSLDAYIMAHALNGLGDHDKARFWLRTAGNLLPSDQYPAQAAAIEADIEALG